jgi:hypothetical protein
MDLGVYVTEKLVAVRLAELRAESARVAALAAARPRRRGMGARLGAGLIRLGQWLAQGDAQVGQNAGVRVSR